MTELNCFNTQGTSLEAVIVRMKSNAAAEKSCLFFCTHRHIKSQYSSNYIFLDVDFISRRKMLMKLTTRINFTIYEQVIFLIVDLLRLLKNIIV
jgi:hypothetical protein